MFSTQVGLLLLGHLVGPLYMRESTPGDQEFHRGKTQPKFAESKDADLGPVPVCITPPGSLTCYMFSAFFIRGYMTHDRYEYQFCPKS